MGRLVDYHVLYRTYFVIDLSHRGTGKPGTQNSAYIELSRFQSSCDTQKEVIPHLYDLEDHTIVCRHRVRRVGIHVTRLLNGCYPRRLPELIAVHMFSYNVNSVVYGRDNKNLQHLGSSNSIRNVVIVNRF